MSGESGEPIAKRNCFGWDNLIQRQWTHLEFSQSTSGRWASWTMWWSFFIKICWVSNRLNSVHAVTMFFKKTSLWSPYRIQLHWWMEESKSKCPGKKVDRQNAATTTSQSKECILLRSHSRKRTATRLWVKKSRSCWTRTGPEWYLPLQAVFTQEKTTRVRLVFDSSSRGHDGLSLNDQLEKGPNYINSLPNFLTAWRWNEVAYAGDVRKKFNQVMVHPDDQVYHRFLWRNNTNEASSVYQWLRLNFGDKPAPDIASNAINTVAKASQVEFPEAARELQDHTYVDDAGGSKATLTEAKQITNAIDAILGKGQFQIKAWHSNRKEIDQSNGERFTDLLGHRWDKQEDSFFFKKDVIVGKVEDFSKRNCLALLAQLWDPIGLVAPVTIKFRIDLPELWSSGYNCDDILPESVQQKWMENVQAMNHLLTFEFDRKLKPSNAVGPPEVHGISDRGEQAYGAVIFLRWTLDDGSYRCVPVMVKPFVAPLKKKSIPRIELLGCLALSRMYDTCQEALKFAKIKDCKRVFWVDSSTALSWIRTPPRQFRPFVSARVAEIQETVGDFRYIRSKSNPADALTRGIEPEQLTSWLEGPSFLRLPETGWPDFQDASQSSQAEDGETLKEKKPPEKIERVNQCSATTREVHASSATREVRKDNPIFSHLLKACSTFPKVCRTLAYVRRFIQNAMKNNVSKGPLSVQELKDSEIQLFKWSQLHLDVILLDKKLVAKTDQNGLLRVHGRLEDVRSWEIPFSCHETINSWTHSCAIYMKSVDTVATKVWSMKQGRSFGSLDSATCQSSSQTSVSFVESYARNLSRRWWAKFQV